MEGLLTELLRVSERASNIARLCRAEKMLFELLVEEKVGNDKNTRFAQDFKTLADVLIQETFKYYLGGKFPLLRNYICGEEVNTFTNALGESITVEVRPTQDETSALLAKVLGGNAAAAHLLAQAVHADVATPPVLPEGVRLLLSEVDIDLGNVGVWIDPLDGTNEYVHGKEAPERDQHGGGIHAAGLQCVVVLVGLFDRRTGDPLLGVMTQPFWKRCPTTGPWQSRQAWGVCAEKCIFNVSPALEHRAEKTTERKVVVTSSSENKAIKGGLTQLGFEVVYAAGAGYKALCVVDSLADAYVLSKGSTYHWDTCGPQAILKAMGGDIVDWSRALKSGRVTKDEALRYSILGGPSEGHGQNQCNSGGILAFRSSDVAQTIVSSQH